MPKLAIFETFKTKKELTGEALRQRNIISMLVTHNNPADRTRTSISQKIAQENGVIWKNIYSGIFKDIDEVFVPLGLVKEEGRLPLKRGPKALQEKGIPYYQLTKEGLLVALSLSEIIGKEKIFEDNYKDFFQEDFLNKVFLNLQKSAPTFTYFLIENYVRAFCDGKINNLLPLTIKNFRKVSDNIIQIQKELLKGFLNLSRSDREVILNFLDEIS